jgi:hypothetical protein
MRQSAEPEAEKQTTVHPNHVTVEMMVLDWRVFDQQNEEAVVDLAAVVMQGVLAFVSKKLEVEGVIDGKVASAEVTE